MTFGITFEQSRGRTSGFDLLRLALAIAVIVFHSLAICYGKEFMDELWRGPFAGAAALILHMFFAFGGFLVSGSFERLSLGEFFAFRLFRVVPALVVVTFACVFLLGPLETKLPLETYFRHQDTLLYLGNAVGYTRFDLPGVFTDLPLRGVNIPFWTIPYEFVCYEALAFLAILGIYRRRTIFFLLVSSVTLLGPFFLDQPKFDTTLSGKVLLVTFMWGVILYRFRNIIPDSRYIFYGCLMFSFAALASHTTSFLGAPAAAYVTVYLGLGHAPRVPLLLNGDYSYGLYLVGWPLGQLHAAWFPESREWFQNSVFSIFFGLCIAALTWHLLEKPILIRRREILTLGARFRRSRLPKPKANDAFQD